MSEKGFEFSITGSNVYNAIFDLLTSQQITLEFLEEIHLRNEAEKMGITYDEMLHTHANWRKERKEFYQKALYELYGDTGSIDDILNDKE
jgi:hypothetical protein